MDDCEQQDVVFLIGRLKLHHDVRSPERQRGSLSETPPGYFNFFLPLRNWPPSVPPCVRFFFAWGAGRGDTELQLTVARQWMNLMKWRSDFAMIPFLLFIESLKRPICHVLPLPELSVSWHLRLFSLCRRSYVFVCVINFFPMFFIGAL